MINRRYLRYRVYRHVEQFSNVFDCVRKDNVKFLRKYLIVFIMLQCYFARKNKNFYKSFFSSTYNVLVKRFFLLKDFFISKIKLARAVLFHTLLSNRSIVLLGKFQDFSLKGGFFVRWINTLFIFIRKLSLFSRFKSTFFFSYLTNVLRSVSLFAEYSTIFLFVRKLVFIYYKTVRRYSMFYADLSVLMKLFKFISKNLFRCLNKFLYSTCYNLIPDRVLGVQKKKRLYQFLLRRTRNFKYLYKYLFFILSVKKKFRFKNSFFSRAMTFRKSLIHNFNLNPSKFRYFKLLNSRRTVSNFFNHLNTLPHVYLYQLNWIPSLTSYFSSSYFYYINGKVCTKFDSLYHGDILTFSSLIRGYFSFSRRSNVKFLYKHVRDYVRSFIFFKPKRRKFSRFFYNKKRFPFYQSQKLILRMRSKFFNYSSKFFSSSVYLSKLYSQCFFLKKRRFSYRRIFDLGDFKKFRVSLSFSPAKLFSFGRLLNFLRLKRKYRYFRYGRISFQRFLKRFHYNLYKRFYFMKRFNLSYHLRSLKKNSPFFINYLLNKFSKLGSFSLFAPKFLRFLSLKGLDIAKMKRFVHVYNSFFPLRQFVRFPWVNSFSNLLWIQRSVMGYLNFVFYSYRYHYILFFKRFHSLFTVLYFSTINYSFNQTHIYNLLNRSKYRVSDYATNRVNIDYMIYDNSTKLRF